MSNIIEKGGLPKFARIRLLWKFMKGRRSLYVAGLVALALEAFFTFASPIVIKVTIDSVLGTLPVSIPPPMNQVAHFLVGPNLDAVSSSGEWVLREWLRAHLWIMGLVLLGFTLFQMLFSFLAGISSAYAAEGTAKAMRDKLYAHVQDLPYETLLRAHSGDWLQRCTSDVETTRRFLALEFFEIGRTLFLAATAIPIMIWLSVPLTLWGLIMIPIILVFSFFFFRAVQKAFLSMDESEGRLSNLIQENVTGVRVVRAFARQQLELGKFSHSSGEFRTLTYRVIAFLALYWGFSSFLGLTQIGIVLGIGLTMVNSLALSLGSLILFVTYEQQLIWPIRQMGRLLADTGKTQVALGRIAELLRLDVESELEDGLRVKVKGRVEFSHVDFSYPDGTEVLKDVSFTLEPGEVLAIVGPTGSGKSTLVHLLDRLYEPSAGKILVDGNDIARMSKRHLRASIALVLQESFLYGKSIRDNIRMAGRSADESQITEAAQASALHGVAESFPRGYDTMVGERGVTLSGGQKQRLALARALIRRAPILVLDDSLSAVDTETDATIRAALKRGQRDGSGYGPASVVIIAHRITTLASADKILVLEEGRVSDIGRHEDLIARPGLYQRLWNLQSRLAEEDGNARTNQC